MLTAWFPRVLLTIRNNNVQNEVNVLTTSGNLSGVNLFKLTSFMFDVVKSILKDMNACVVI